jgi:hypothetical protein
LFVGVFVAGLKDAGQNVFEYGSVGGSSTFGGLMTLAGLVGSQPDSWTKRKKVRIASNFFRAL